MSLSRWYWIIFTSEPRSVGWLRQWESVGYSHTRLCRWFCGEKKGPMTTSNWKIYLILATNMWITIHNFAGVRRPEKSLLGDYLGTPKVRGLGAFGSWLQYRYSGLSVVGICLWISDCVWSGLSVFDITKSHTWFQRSSSFWYTQDGRSFLRPTGKTAQ